MQEQEIIDRIMSLHPNATIEVNGADCSFEVYVLSDDFAGKNTLERQRPLLALFNDELKTGKLHALSIKAKTQAELAGGGGLVQIQL